jgi:short-subunit dehydrogenase involved in D-alanine esterification of teichoic acids
MSSDPGGSALPLVVDSAAPVACASYEAVHRYDEALVEHGKRDAIVPCR